jgi:hypothetical protein
MKTILITIIAFILGGLGGVAVGHRYYLTPPDNDGKVIRIDTLTGQMWRVYSHSDTSVLPIRERR